MSFGALAVAAGLSPAQAIASSLLVFTGASQFAFIGVLAAGGGLVAATLPAVILATRNGLYGVAVARRSARSAPEAARLFAPRHR